MGFPASELVITDIEKSSHSENERMSFSIRLKAELQECPNIYSAQNLS